MDTRANQRPADPAWCSTRGLCHRLRSSWNLEEKVRKRAEGPSASLRRNSWAQSLLLVICSYQKNDSIENDLFQGLPSHGQDRDRVFPLRPAASLCYEGGVGLPSSWNLLVVLHVYSTNKCFISWQVSFGFWFHIHARRRHDSVFLLETTNVSVSFCICLGKRVQHFRCLSRAYQRHCEGELPTGIVFHVMCTYVKAVSECV